ncbi:MAG: HlyD family efflux transporter periplasmic adaptor subunit [Myxococcota bacterium]
MTTITEPLPRNHAKSRQRSLSWAKWGTGAVLVLGAVIFAWLAFRPKPVIVDVHPVALGKLEVFIEEDGRTKMRERYVVSAPLNGNMARIELEPGDAVLEGQTVARFDPPSPALLDARTRAETEARLAGALAHVRQSEAAYERAKTAHELTEKNLVRVQALAKNAAISNAELERSELETRMASEEEASGALQRRVAEAEVRSIRAVLGRLKEGGNDEIALAAPASGDVLHVLRESAGPVAAGTPLIEIGDPRVVEVVVDLLSADAVRVRPGTKASIERWGGEGNLSGRVRRVEPAAFTRVSALGVEEQRVNVVIALDAIPPGLGDNYRVEAKLLEWTGDSVLTVPRSAVFRQQDQWAVYTVTDGQAHLVPIELGHRGRLDVEVKNGLKPGDAVVLYPGDRVHEGAALRPRAP